MTFSSAISDLNSGVVLFQGWSLKRGVLFTWISVDALIL